MSTITIVPGALVTKDPADVKVYEFDWDADNLAASVTIATSAFSVFVSPTTADALTIDNASILSGSRKTQVRLAGGTIGARYAVNNRIVTSESPTQTKECSFQLRIEQQ